MDRRKLETEVEQQIDRKRRAQRAAGTLLARTTYFGTLGLMLTLPIVAGAYLGNWLDDHARDFSFSWTVSLIVIGVFVGAFNAVWFVRQTWS
ncbi:MAG TPA: AtpZ/AtpI family protein [Candidatus Acidoferrales bacterium]|nr:AtpZ/AtpI family protein [Candidatus Acidoferrales bacterium]